VKGALADTLAARFESILEERTGALISDRLYDRNDRLESEIYYWKACPDFPREQFMIPENLEQIRPKTAKEAGKLKRELLAEEAKSLK
jgi:hypothetical protein